MSTERRAALFGWILSLAAHAAIVGYIVWRTSTPDVGLEFELPMEVEFGMTEAVIARSGGSSAPPTPPPPGAESAEGEGEGAGADAGVPLDAGPTRPDAGRAQPDAGPEIASAEEIEGEGEPGGEGRGVAFLPAGSQIALRLDVARVRRSALADDVRGTLGAMPDWQALIAGSGIQPLDDLDRLLVASPNLRRDRIVTAGRASADEASIRAAAERLASASGATLEWRTVEGVPVADWHDQDATERVIALIGPTHFVIARPEDLPRVIAVARVRADREAEEGEEPPQHPADALLSMEEGEGLSLEVEGARNFARGRRTPIEMVPTRLRVAFSELPNDEVALRTRWTYDDEEQAIAAAAFWNRLREAYARNVIAAVLGFNGILSRATIEAHGDTLRAEVDLTLGEMRRILSFVRGYFEDRQRDERPPLPQVPPEAPPPQEPPAPPPPRSEIPPSPY